MQALLSSALLQPGRKSGNEGGQRCARIRFVNHTVTAASEEHCLTMRIDSMVQAGFVKLGDVAAREELCLTMRVNNAVQAL